MTRIDVASYGAVGNAHGLLGTSATREALPRELAGLVDKPPHHPDGALPLLACARVPPYFAVWRTFADPNAPRRGMVRSFVALVRLEDVASISNLETIVLAIPAEINGDQFSEALDLECAAPSPPVLTPRYNGLCNELVRSSRTKPVVVPDEGDWANLLVTLWANLWPAARAHLSCLHAIGPEAEPAAPCTVLVTPVAAVNKWAGYPVIAPAAKSDTPAAILTGSTTADIGQLQEALGTLPHDLRLVGNLEAASSLLARFKAGGADVPELKALLEFSCRFVQGGRDEDGIATAFLAHLLSELSSKLAHGGMGDVLALANLQVPETLDTTRLRAAVTDVVAAKFAAIDVAQASMIMRRLSDKRYASWWLESVRHAASTALVNPSIPTWQHVFEWCVARPALIGDLFRILELEKADDLALARAWPRSTPITTAEAVIAVARETARPRLHAAALASAFDAIEAWRRQVALADRARDGVPILLERLDGEGLIAIATSFDDDDVRRRAAAALVAAPAYLRKLEISNSNWLRLWERALISGLEPWAGVLDRRAVALQLVQRAAQLGDVPEPLLVALLAEAPIDASELPPTFWSAASQRVADAMRRGLAARWLATLPHAAAPTPQFIPAIVEVVRTQISRHSFPIAHLPRVLDETNTRSLVQSLLDAGRVPLPAAVARELGLRVRAWGDATVANNAFELWDRGWRDLEPLLIECVGLLSGWRRWRLPPRQAPSHEDVHALFVELGQILCELYPDGPPGYVWEDSGGKAWTLPHGQTGHERWRVGLGLIERQASGAPRAVKLIDEVRSNFSNSRFDDRLVTIRTWLDWR